MIWAVIYGITLQLTLKRRKCLTGGLLRRQSVLIRAVMALAMLFGVFQVAFADDYRIGAQDI